MNMAARVAKLELAGPRYRFAPATTEADIERQITELLASGISVHSFVMLWSYISDGLATDMVDRVAAKLGCRR
jgi:hypothetical protein